MRYIEAVPSPAIRPYVECLWALDGWTRGGALDPVLPDGHPEIIVHSGDPFASVAPSGVRTLQAPVLVAGQMRHALALTALGHAHVAGARLRPHGLKAFFGGSCEDLTDLVVDLASIDLQLARHLLVDVAARPTPMERMHALDRALCRWANGQRIDPLVGQACELATARRGLTRVSSLVRDAGLSARQFERRFGAQVGLSPKAFLRVVRFQQVLKAMDGGGPTDWARLAVEHGFYDQPHFVNDFKAFTGLAPTEWNITDDSLTAVFSVGRGRDRLNRVDVGFFQDAHRSESLA
jgi:AraC-like DNA-binding protein